ncbi:unnamed protein product [Boreogadus saida]
MHPTRQQRALWYHNKCSGNAVNHKQSLCVVVSLVSLVVSLVSQCCGEFGGSGESSSTKEQVRYIPAGGLTIAADRKPTRAKVCAALGMNVLVALSTVAGSVLHFFASVLFAYPTCHLGCKHLINSELFMLAASILLFIVSILVVSSAVAALCASRKPSKENTVI